jgi:hypothetical protein
MIGGFLRVAVYPPAALKTVNATSAVPTFTLFGAFASPTKIILSTLFFNSPLISSVADESESAELDDDRTPALNVNEEWMYAPDWYLYELPSSM